jgi:chromosome segregation ATPase
MQAQLKTATEQSSRLTFENSQHRARISSLDTAKTNLEADLSALRTKERAASERVDSLTDEVRCIKSDLASQRTSGAQETTARQVRIPEFGFYSASLKNKEEGGGVY